MEKKEMALELLRKLWGREFDENHFLVKRLVRLKKKQLMQMSFNLWEKEN